MFGYIWFTVFSQLLFYFNNVFGGCDTEKDCVFHSWMPWEPCIGQCGNQKQLRQREFCCPRYVASKTPENCLSACLLPVDGNGFDEYKPCCLCYNVHCYQTIHVNVMMDIRDPVVKVCPFIIQLHMKHTY